MEAKPTAEMALQHQGPDRRHQDRALRRTGVGAGRARGRGRHARQHPGHGRLRREPARAAARRAGHEEAPARRHLHARVLGPARRAGPRTGHVNPGMFEGRKRGVIFDVGHGGGSFALAHRRARHQGGLPARLDLDRPPHRQHERRHEGHAQRDEQVPRDGPVARRRDRALDLEPGARDQAGGPRAPLGRRAGRRRRAAPGEGHVRLRRHVRRAPAGATRSSSAS